MFSRKKGCEKRFSVQEHHNRFYVGNECREFGRDRYVHEDLTVQPSMRDSSGKMHYLETREEAEKRLEDFLRSCLDFKVEFNNVKGLIDRWYISAWDKNELYRFAFLHPDGKIRPDMFMGKMGKETIYGYFPTKEDAEKFLKEHKDKHMCMGTSEPVAKGKFVDSTLSGEAPQYTSARVQQNDTTFGTKTPIELVSKLNQLRLDEGRMNNHVQLLLENDVVPTVTPVRARLVTDGGTIVLELLTPGQMPQAVARLEVKNGQVVMYRTQGVKDRLINTDASGRIQN